MGEFVTAEESIILYFSDTKVAPVHVSGLFAVPAGTIKIIQFTMPNTTGSLAKTNCLTRLFTRGQIGERYGDCRFHHHGSP